MKLRVFNLLALLSILLGIAACGEKPAPTKIVIVTRQAMPVIVTAIATEQPTAAPIEMMPEPTAALTAPATPRPGYFSQNQLIEDARQLADIIESTHPDPYFNGGGRIAFYRRLQRVLNAIPEEGMTRQEFTRLLIPFIAGVGDGHTVLHNEYSASPSRPGVPLGLGVIEDNLYVASIPQGIDTSLLGSLLISVEGIPVAELCERQKRMEGTDNLYHALQSLAEKWLRYRPYMQDLIPEWEDTGHVTVELQRPTGEIEAITDEVSLPGRGSPSRHTVFSIDQLLFRADTIYAGQ